MLRFCFRQKLILESIKVGPGMPDGYFSELQTLLVSKTGIPVTVFDVVFNRNATRPNSVVIYKAGCGKIREMKLTSN